MNLPLHVVSETATTITLGWTPPAGALGYVFTSTGTFGTVVKSHTMDGTRKSVKFNKNSASYSVTAMGALATGTYPDAAPPVEPPVGQLANMWLEWGTPVPFKDSSEDFGGFNCVDFQGYGQGPNSRITEVAHPLDPARRALKFSLPSGDQAGHFGGHRCELYRKPGDLVGVSWHAFSWVLTDAYRPPSITSTLFQIHGGDSDPSSNQSPAEMFGVEPNEDMRWYVRGLQDVTLGKAPRNVEIRGLVKVNHAQDPSGYACLWLTTDGTVPAEQRAATCATVGVTSALPPGKPSYTKAGLYSQPLSPTTEAFLCGFGRADTSGRAKWLAGWAA